MPSMSLSSRLAAAWQAWAGDAAPGQARRCGVGPVALDAAPPADPALRCIVEGCAAYARLGPALVSLEPAESWQTDQLHYFLYRLHPPAPGRTPHALFIVHQDADTPLSAVVVTPGARGLPSSTLDLMRSGSPAQDGGR